MVFKAFESGIFSLQADIYSEQSEQSENSELSKRSSDTDH